MKTWIGAFVGFVAFLPIAAVESLAQTTRVSVSSSGEQANDVSFYPSLSDDGRFVVYQSGATNLVGFDVNGWMDVYLHDRLLGETTCISVSPSFFPSNGHTTAATISGNGRYILFGTRATNMDGLGLPGLFVHDREDGLNRRVALNVFPNGLHRDGPTAISADGRFVAYALSDDYAMRIYQTHLLDRETNEITEIVDPLSGESIWFTSMSADARYFTYSRDIQPESWSERYRTYVLDRLAATALDVTADLDPDGSLRGAQISADGKVVLFSENLTNVVTDQPAGWHVFAREFPKGSPTIVDVGPHDQPFRVILANRSPLSASGRHVVFTSAEYYSDDANGRFQTFHRDRERGRTKLVSVNSSGVQGDYISGYGGDIAISGNGRVVAFSSFATNLVEGDTNAVWDIFVHELPELLEMTTIEPASGSESGGDLVHVRFTSPYFPADASIRIGSELAEIVSQQADEVLVRTPPGSGSVDVAFSSAGETDVLRGAFSYRDPSIAARYGNVHVGRGDRESVLFVNASAGDPVTRETQLGVGSPVRVVITSPSSRSQSRYVVYAWRGLSRRETLTPIGGGLGSMVFPTPFTAGSPQPLAIWNTLGFRRTLGEPTAPSSPAPTKLFSRPGGFQGAARLTFQGLIQDDASPTSAGISVTNAILLRVDP